MSVGHVFLSEKEIGNNLSAITCVTVILLGLSKYYIRTMNIAAKNSNRCNNTKKQGYKKTQHCILLRNSEKNAK